MLAARGPSPPRSCCLNASWLPRMRDSWDWRRLRMASAYVPCDDAPLPRLLPLPYFSRRLRASPKAAESSAAVPYWLSTSPAKQGSRGGTCGGAHIAAACRATASCVDGARGQRMHCPRQPAAPRPAGRLPELAGEWPPEEKPWKARRRRRYRTKPAMARAGTRMPTMGPTMMPTFVPWLPSSANEKQGVAGSARWSHGEPSRPCLSWRMSEPLERQATSPDGHERSWPPHLSC